MSNVPFRCRRCGSETFNTASKPKSYEDFIGAVCASAMPHFEKTTSENRLVNSLKSLREKLSKERALSSRVICSAMAAVLNMSLAFCMDKEMVQLRGNL